MTVLKRSGTAICVGLAMLAGTSVARAHHGIANFDLNADIELSGTVRDVEFLNPHSWLHLDVDDGQGGSTAWRCELRGATVLRRSGWSPDMFPEGLRITVTGSPDRREPATCYLGTAIFPDGSSIDRYGQLSEPAAAPQNRAARIANGDPNIAGDWAAEQRVMTDPRGQSGTLVPISSAESFAPGGVPQGQRAFPGSRGTELSLSDDPVDTYWNKGPSALPLTNAGKAAIADFDGASTDNPRLRCEPTNILFDWTFEMDVNRIEQNPQQIKMYYGSMGIERTIHLNMSAHPDSLTPSIAGHSIGRWENDVLVVDTVGFAPGILSADGRLPHSGSLHVEERFTLDSEAVVLRRSYVAEDPLYFVGQYTGGDSVLVSNLPYHGTSECEDRSYGNMNSEAEAAEPWYMFLKFWD